MPTIPRDNPRYLAYIRRQACLCGHCPPPSVPSHEPLFDTGFGLKCPDLQTVPLSYMCHEKRHLYGHQTFYRRINVDVQLSMLRCLEGYIVELEDEIVRLKAGPQVIHPEEIPF